MDAVLEVLRGLLSAMPRETEFWSAIFGAIVGGAIGLGGQVIELRAKKRERELDHTRVQHALAHSLLFKMMTIRSNVYRVHRHIEECFEEAAQEGAKGEPWGVYLPPANPFEPVHFSAEEMSMLLAQKHDDVFNLVLSMDAAHNGLIDGMKVLGNKRETLLDRLQHGDIEGDVGIIDLDKNRALRPRMLEVNSLIEQIRARAKHDSDRAGEALQQLNEVVRDKFGLAYKFEAIASELDGARPEPLPLPSISREDVKALVRSSDPDAFVACPVCQREMKVKKLLRHFDTRHGP